MTLWGRTHWQEGFPFSPTRLRPQAPARPPCAAEAVTAARIPEAGTPPIPWAAPTDAAGPMTHPDPVPSAAPSRLAPHRPGLRLMPLAAFAWAGPGVRRGGTPALPRTRPEHLLIWLVSGRMRLQIARQATEMQPGSLRFIPAGTALAAHPLPGAEGHVLTLAPDLTTDLDPALPRQVTAGHPGAGGAALLVTLRDLADEAARATDRRALACHLNLLSLRLSRLDPEPGRVPAATRGNAANADAPRPDRPLVERFLALAAVELGQCRSLAGLAQDLGTTLTVLDRSCLEARGRRAVDLLHGLRLDRAAELLRHTDCPPGRIAQDLGYASHAHLTRAFVTATGRTPEAYRVQMRQP
ncbi:helix-turn-helix transcriptional regulator [Paracoccus gahaiensis]|uniref:Helix-turn-helix transcriptional regulator n=1 Tax=Paracoccus gahaiensis TaxID=1706839 RepID=A0A4U0RXF5_9RHOB|nr:AraC family transcriptional regulator [Paracoccus gahaiensis]TJZ93034.1 helix-turn-helix transcriptional regulator [Paracoccus gahaiensis]